MLKVIWNVIKKIFGIFGLVLSPLKRLWCRRKRRTSDTILPLANHYPSVDSLSTGYAVNGTSEYQQELSPWDNWEETDKIRSVEEYRQRQQQQQQRQLSQEPEEETDYFQDMAPKLKKQKKVLIQKKEDRGDSFSSKLAMTADIPVLPTSELGSWEDTSNAWEADADEDLTWEADNVIREKRKAERQQRQLEQQRKKLEREQQKHGKSHSQLSAVKLS